MNRERNAKEYSLFSLTSWLSYLFYSPGGNVFQISVLMWHASVTKYQPHLRVWQLMCSVRIVCYSLGQRLLSLSLFCYASFIVKKALTYFNWTGCFFIRFSTVLLLSSEWLDLKLCTKTKLPETTEWLKENMWFITPWQYTKNIEQLEKT